MINAIFSQFVEVTPITVMVKGIMERIFEPTALDELFETHAVKQYTRELCFIEVTFNFAPLVLVVLIKLEQNLLMEFRPFKASK